jgi:transcriptional regulator with XRE-family HTH domain
LARRHCGATQHRLAAATGLTQGRISGLLRGSGGPVTSLEIWERIAEGLNLPDTARYVLGLAPEQARVTSTSLPGGRPRAPVTSPFVRRGVGQRRWMDVPGSTAALNWLSRWIRSARESQREAIKRMFEGLRGALTRPAPRLGVAHG